MIEKLIELNNKIINDNQNNSSILNRQILIKKLLNDKDCFFKIDLETAFSILRDLQIVESEIKSMYSELIDSKNYTENNN